MLYKSKKEQTITCDVVQKDGITTLTFHSDGGKLGTDVLLAEYKLSAERLLQILFERDDYSDDEL